MTREMIMLHPGLLQLRQFPGERGRDHVVEGLLLAAQTAGRDDRLGKVPQRSLAPCSRPRAL
jgi:hypothetical protein